jgi:hypothetical protein
LQVDIDGHVDSSPALFGRVSVSGDYSDFLDGAAYWGAMKRRQAGLRLAILTHGPRDADDQTCACNLYTLCLCKRRDEDESRSARPDAAAVEAEFSRRVAEAETGVISHVRKQKLPQDKVLDSADVASLTDEQATALVGKTMVVRRDSVMFDGEPCREPELTRHREDAAQYMREGYHARVGNLGLPDTITVIDLDCTEAFLGKKGRIVVFWDGYFFDAIKQPPAKH